MVIISTPRWKQNSHVASGFMTHSLPSPGSKKRRKILLAPDGIEPPFAQLLLYGSLERPYLPQCAVLPLDDGTLNSRLKVSAATKS